MRGCRVIVPSRGAFVLGLLAIVSLQLARPPKVPVFCQYSPFYCHVTPIVAQLLRNLPHTTTEPQQDSVKPVVYNGTLSSCRLFLCRENRVALQSSSLQNMGVSKNRGSQYSTLNSRMTIIRTPNKVPPFSETPMSKGP